MIKTFKLANGNLIHFKKDPRYGFWTVNFDKGGAPGNLSGVFTSFSDIYAKADHYLRHRKTNPTEILEEVTDHGA